MGAGDYILSVLEPETINPVPWHVCLNLFCILLAFHIALQDVHVTMHLIKTCIMHTYQILMILLYDLLLSLLRVSCNSLGPQFILVVFMFTIGLLYSHILCLKEIPYTSIIMVTYIIINLVSCMSCIQTGKFGIIRVTCTTTSMACCVKR